MQSCTHALMFIPRAPVRHALSNQNCVFSGMKSSLYVWVFPNCIQAIQLGHFPTNFVWCNTNIPQFRGFKFFLFVFMIKIIRMEGLSAPWFWAEPHYQRVMYYQHLCCQTEPDVLLNWSQVRQWAERPVICQRQTGPVFCLSPSHCFYC